MSNDMYDGVVNSYGDYRVKNNEGYGDNRNQSGGYKPPPAKRLPQTPNQQAPRQQQTVYIQPEDDSSKVKHDFSFGGAFRLGLGAGIGFLFAIPAAIILTALALSFLGISLSALFS
ncbi:MAG: hypothetical protein OXE52_05695 [Chloroflexi bacterium]|nr:hypothetical protein [Chloroflexota bacterium]